VDPIERKYRLDEPDDGTFEEQLRKRLRELKPEAIESNPHGALQHALDILDLPRNVVANLVNLAVRAEPASKETAFGLRRVYGSDLLRGVANAVGVHPEEFGTAGKIAHGVAGFLADVAMDPLTWATGGATGVFGTGARKIGKQVLTKGAAKKAAQLAESLAQTPHLAQAVAGPGLAARGLAAGVDVGKTGGELTELGRAYEAAQRGERITEEAARHVAETVPGALDQNAIGISSRGLKHFGPFDLPVALGSIVAGTVAPAKTRRLLDLYEKVAPYQRPFRWLPEFDKTLVTKPQLRALSDRIGLGKLGELANQVPYLPEAAQAVQRGAQAVGRELQRKFSTVPVRPIAGDVADEARYEAEKLQQFSDAMMARAFRNTAYKEPKKLRAWLAQAEELSGLQRPAISEIVMDVTERRRSMEYGRESGQNIATWAERIAAKHGGDADQAQALVKFIEDTLPPAEGLTPFVKPGPMAVPTSPVLSPAAETDLFGNPLADDRLETGPTQGVLFTPEELAATKAKPGGAIELKTGTAGMIAKFMAEQVPGRAAPTAEKLRDALVNALGPRRTQDWFQEGIWSKRGLGEIQEAIDQSQKGGYLFPESSAGKWEGGKVGTAPTIPTFPPSHLPTPEVVKSEPGMVFAPGAAPVPAGSGRELGAVAPVRDSERNEFQAVLRLVPERTLLASHKAVSGPGGHVVRMESVPEFPAGYQNRPRDTPASVAQVDLIRARPKYDELLDFGPLAVAGPPIVWQHGDALALAQGNGRIAAMRKWKKAQWAEYRAELEQRYGAEAVATEMAGPAWRPGDQPVLVRELQAPPGGTVQDAAGKIAPLGQGASTLAEGRIEKARANLFALNIGANPMPSVVVREPVTRENLSEFVKTNPRWVDWLMGGLKPEPREMLLASPDELAARINDVWIASLPRSVQDVAGRSTPELETAFLSLAAPAAELHSKIQRGLIHPAFDLYPTLATAADIYRRELAKNRGSYGDMVRQLLDLGDTGTFAGMEDTLSGASRRAVVLAIGLATASKRANPSEALTAAVNEILQRGRDFDPRQLGLMGPIDPAAHATEVYARALLGPQRGPALVAKLEGRFGLEEAVAPQSRVTTETTEGTEAALKSAAPVSPESSVSSVSSPVPKSPALEAIVRSRPGLETELTDVHRAMIARGESAAEADRMAVVAAHFSDEALTGLRTLTSPDVRAVETAAGLGIKAAAAYYPPNILTDAEKTLHRAKGIIRLLDQVDRYDTPGLWLEEVGHHLYSAVAGPAERDLVQQWYASKTPAEWAVEVRRRGIRPELADYYAGTGVHAAHAAEGRYDPAQELWTRYLSDFAMGKEIDADPAMKSLFTKVLEALGAMWRALVQRGDLIHPDPRIEELIGKFYRAPESAERVTAESAKIAEKELTGPPSAAGGPGLGVSESARPVSLPAAGPRPTHPPLDFPPPPMDPGAPGFGVSERARAVRLPPVIPPPTQPPLDFPALEQGGPGPRGKLWLAPPLKEVTDYLAERSAQRIAESTARGVPAPELSTQREMGYFTRVLVDDGKTALGRWFRRGVMSLRSRFQKQRLDWAREKFTTEANQILGLVNDIQAQGGSAAAMASGNADAAALRAIEAMALKPGERVPSFGTDVVLAHTLRELDHQKTLGTAELLREMASRFGMRVHEHAQAPSGWVRVQNPAWGDLTREFYFRPEVAQLLERHIGQWDTPDNLLGAYRRVLNLWKGWALVAPAYHLRNLWGNAWNLRMVDAWQERAFADARDLQRSMAGVKHAPSVDTAIQGTLGPRGKPWTYKTLWEALALDHGMIGSGFYGFEVSRNAEQLRDLLEKIDNPASLQKAVQLLKTGHPVKANQILGQIGEEGSKIGGVIARLRKGDTLEQAVATVQKALFDYHDLSDFERGTMSKPGVRDVWPFYTWTRKNAELLLSLVFTKPAELALVPKIQGNIEAALVGEEVLPPSLRPPHILKEAGVQLSGGTHPRFANIGYMLPIGELRYLNPMAPGQAVRAALEQIGGPVRTAVELATNRDTYFDRAIVEYPGQQKEMLGVPLDPRTKHVLRTLRPLNFAEQMNQMVSTAASPEGAVAGGAAMATGLRTFDVSVARQVGEQERRVGEQLSAVRRDMKRRIAELLDQRQEPAGDAELHRLAGLLDGLEQQRAALPRLEAGKIQRTLSKRRQEQLKAYMDEERRRQAD
jgi:hypothetical protein